MASLDPIVRLLTERKTLPEAVLRRAQSQSATTSAFLGTILDAGVPEVDLVAVMAEHLGIPGVDMSRTSIDLSVLESVPRAVAESDIVLPLSMEGGRLHVAVNAAAENFDVLEELRFITGQEVSPYAAMPAALEQAITAAYDAKEKGESVWRGIAAEASAATSFAAVLPEPRAGEHTEVIALGEVVEDAEELEELEELPAEEDVELEVGADTDDDEVLEAVAVRSGPARILAVDDDPDILRILDRTLRSAGYLVEQARDGREAEQKLKAGRYDLVVLDAMLPHVHGFEICARLKASPRTRTLPVILVSAVYRGWRYAHDARETFGADDYLEKPFHIPELLRRVEARLSGGAAAATAASTAKADKLYEEGLELLESKKPAEARAVLEKAVKEDAFSPRAHFALARAMHEQGELFHAITAYERAVELRPNLFQALRALAGLYEQKGFRRKAVEALERAVHAAPDPQTRDSMRQRLLRLL
ncbi:MAG TPA: response regulator [Myxococcales bacterium]|nr:response regulator [Myxococcales bacterium]